MKTENNPLIPLLNMAVVSVSVILAILLIMNKNTIVDFKLGNNKGIFVAVPYSIKNFTIEHQVSETYLMETDSKELNNWKTKIPKGDYKYIGRSNELSPEFVESELNVSFKEYTNMLNKMDITVNYSDHSNFWAILLTERYLT